MTINQSPIFKLLQAAYTDIELDDNLFKISSQLFKMVISDYYKLPEHLKNFFQKINDGIHIEQLDEILSVSIKEMTNNPCENCLNCQGCCKLFYASLAQKFINEDHGIAKDIYDKWQKFINETKNKLGDCNFTPIPQNIRKHIITNDTIYDTYSKQKEKAYQTRNIKNSLFILKGLSSSTPYLYNSIISNGHFTGGGLFINWDNLGIVIDPGFGFVENMQKNKIFIDDIDIVIITHFHIDHTNDIRLLDDLNRSINHKVKDFDSEEEYNVYRSISKHKYHQIKWFVDSDTHQHLMQNLNPLINDIHILNESEFNVPINLSESIEFLPFPTQHVQVDHLEAGNIRSKFKNNTFGFKLRLKDLTQDKYAVFGYTSDTAFFGDLLEYLSDVTYLVANISGIYEDDYLQIKYKGRHLGYAGCKKILEKTSPQILIVSEFWNGVTDLRYDVCKDLQNYAQSKVLPGEIGLQINLLNDSVKCSICGSFTNSEKISVVAPIGQMAKISFICDDCRY